MEKFTVIKSICCPIAISNIDTDMIIPKQFLKTTKRTGLGQHLFSEQRFDTEGKKIESFNLNKEKYKNSKIIISGSNFGCGSSREHAPWAFLDYGIRCIIASSFADIFYNNCFKNSILPIILPEDEIKFLMQFADNEDEPILEVNLPDEKITLQYNNTKKIIKFAIESSKKHKLLEGLDDISLTLKEEQAITDFEERYKKECNFIFQVKVE